MDKGSLWPKKLWQFPKPGGSVIVLIVLIEAKFDCVLFDQIEVADCVCVLYFVLLRHHRSIVPFHQRIGDSI